MNRKKLVNITIIALCICLVVGVGSFIYNGTNEYKINNDFVSVPLQFNPDNSTSSYQMEGSDITVHGGFIKGIQKSKDGTKSLVIRALSPLPTISVKGNNSNVVSLMIENINPDFYAKSTIKNKLSMTKVTVNTLQFKIAMNPGEKIKINPVRPSSTENKGKYKYIILGDNRDGYDTFEQIIQQVNAENPAFVIDNGDLVFSGKSNQYRLFDKTVSKISTTLCTTLGNHDIRGKGRSTYNMLYGPEYYSFDFADSHFVFLDSSPGWSEKQAISDEQYTWLEKDLKKSKDKRIFVFTHIPPRDPRSDVTPNEIANYVNKVENDKSWVEQKLNSYNETKNMDHGFQDPLEATKFESMMSKYHVDTVYLSHIHSYFEYTKDGVRYLISGGAGAELLTKNSYYHYLIEKVDNVKTSTVIELPSPANNYIARYVATAQLFANAMYEENPMAVSGILIGVVLFLCLLILKIYLWKRQPFKTIGKWIYDTVKFSSKRFKELFFNKK